MKVIRSFFRHIRDGLRNLLRNGWMTLVSVLTMALTLIMVGLFVFVIANVDALTKNIEQTIQVRVSIDLIATPEEEAKLKSDIEKVEHVVGVTYRTKDEELEDIIQNFGSDFELFKEDTNPLSNVYVVDVDAPNNLKTVADALAKLPHVDSAKYGEFDSETLLRNIETVRIVVAVIATVFVVIAVLLVSNAIRLTIFARRTEIEIMHLVGATRRYIRAPFVYEGAFIGLIGGVLSVAGLYGIYELAQNLIPQALNLANLNMVPTFPLLSFVAIGLLVLGIALGMLGARRSIRRFLEV